MTTDERIRNLAKVIFDDVNNSGPISVEGEIHAIVKQAISEETHALRYQLLESEKKINGSKEFIKSMAMRHNSQLMSVYHLLTAVSKTGTHSEKRNVIMYLQTVLQDLIHCGDSLPLSDEEMNNCAF